MFNKRRLLQSTLFIIKMSILHWVSTMTQNRFLQVCDVRRKTGNSKYMNIPNIRNIYIYIRVIELMIIILSKRLVDTLLLNSKLNTYNIKK